MADKESFSQAQNSSLVSFTEPPEWSDEDRMHYLLSPFSLSANPSTQDPKLSFWSTLILNSSKELKKPLFTEEELKNRFRWNQTLCPTCLGTVIEYMERSGVVMKQKEFIESSDRAGWFVWGLKMVAKPVGWALKSYFPNSKYTCQYIITSLVKEYADQVVSRYKAAVLHKSTDLVMKASDFDAFASKLLSADSFPLVKSSLLRDGIIVIRSTDSGDDVLKICDGKQTGVSEVDVGIVRIKESIKRLREQVESLTLRVQKLKQSAKENSKVDKKKAIRLLRQNKVLEGLLETREANLENLQTALQQIQMAETDIMVMEAYKSSVSALRSVREGLTVEDAEDTLGELQEAIEDGQEISSALSAGLGQGSEWEDDELERELTELLKSDQTGNYAATAASENKGASSIEEELEAQLASLTLLDSNISLPSPEDKMPLADIEDKAKRKQTGAPLLA